MPTSTILESDRRSEVYEWLTEQAKSLGIPAFLQRHQAKEFDGRLYVPVYIADATDAYDSVTKLQLLEDTWNYREPEPSARIFLVPTDERPPEAEVYEPVRRAISRYDEAFSVFRATRSPEEADRALEEMKAAKVAELEASELYERAA